MFDGQSVNPEFEEQMTNVGSATGIAPMPPVLALWSQAFIVTIALNKTIWAASVQMMNPYRSR